MNKEEFEEMLNATTYILVNYINEIMELYSLTKEEYLSNQEQFIPFIVIGIEILLSESYGKDKSEVFLKEFAVGDVNKMAEMYL